MSDFPQEVFKSSESTKMTLTDMSRLKQLADDMSFMRLFFLKGQPNAFDGDRSGADGPASGNSLELIDCILGIFLFELTRVVRTGRTLFRRDQFQFQVLHFFSHLKACKPIEKAFNFAEDDSTQISKQHLQDDSPSRSSRSSSLGSEDLSQLISTMKLECEESIFQNLSGCKDGGEGDNIEQPRPARRLQPAQCKNCLVDINQSKAFTNLYKRLVDDILKFQA